MEFYSLIYMCSCNSSTTKITIVTIIVIIIITNFTFYELIRLLVYSCYCYHVNIQVTINLSFHDCTTKNMSDCNFSFS